MLQNENLICADMQSQSGPQDQKRTFTQKSHKLPAITWYPRGIADSHNSKDKQQTTVGNIQL